MLRNLIGKRKAKRELLKFYYMCEKKRQYILHKAWDGKQYDEIKSLQYAIAYILYKYFNCRTFDIVWDYTHNISDKDIEHIYKVMDNNEHHSVYYCNNNELYQPMYHTIHVGDVFYNIDDNTTKIWDGKNFQNMC